MKYRSINGVKKKGFNMDKNNNNIESRSCIRGISVRSYVNTQNN